MEDDIEVIEIDDKLKTPPLPLQKCITNVNLQSKEGNEKKENIPKKQNRKDNTNSFIQRDIDNNVEIQMSLMSSTIKIFTDLQQKLLDELCINKICFSTKVIAKISQIAETVIKSKWAHDLKAYSRHAKRATITADDVRLIFQRNGYLLKKIEKVVNEKESNEDILYSTNEGSSKFVPKNKNLTEIPSNNRAKKPIAKKNDISEFKNSFLKSSNFDLNQSSTHDFKPKSTIESLKQNKNYSANPNYEIRSTPSIDHSQLSDTTSENYNNLLVESSQSTTESMKFSTIIGPPIVIDDGSMDFDNF